MVFKTNTEWKGAYKWNELPTQDKKRLQLGHNFYSEWFTPWPAVYTRYQQIICTKIKTVVESCLNHNYTFQDTI